MKRVVLYFASSILSVAFLAYIYLVEERMPHQFWLLSSVFLLPIGIGVIQYAGFDRVFLRAIKYGVVFWAFLVPTLRILMLAVITHDDWFNVGLFVMIPWIQVGFFILEMLKDEEERALRDSVIQTLAGSVVAGFLALIVTGYWMVNY